MPSAQSTALAAGFNRRVSFRTSVKLSLFVVSYRCFFRSFAARREFVNGNLLVVVTFTNIIIFLIFQHSDSERERKVENVEIWIEILNLTWIPLSDIFRRLNERKRETLDFFLIIRY